MGFAPKRTVASMTFGWLIFETFAFGAGIKTGFPGLFLARPHACRATDTRAVVSRHASSCTRKRKPADTAASIKLAAHEESPLPRLKVHIFTRQPDHRKTDTQAKNHGLHRVIIDTQQAGRQDPRDGRPSASCRRRSRRSPTRRTGPLRDPLRGCVLRLLLSNRLRNGRGRSAPGSPRRRTTRQRCLASSRLS